MSVRLSFFRLAARVACVVVAVSVVGCTASSELPPAASSVVGPSTARATTAASAGGTSTSVAPATTTTITTSSVPATNTPNPKFPPEQQAVADGYQHAMAVFDRTGIVGGLPVDPELPVTMVDPMLGHVRIERTNAYDRGEQVRLPNDSKSREVVKSIEIEGASATVLVCSVDDAIVYKTATGEIVDDEVSTADVEARMRLIDGSWKLAEREVSNQRAGAQSCG